MIRFAVITGVVIASLLYFFVLSGKEAAGKDLSQNLGEHA